MLRNERLLLNISLKRRPILVYRKFKDVFLIFDNNKYKTYLLAFDKFMWTRCVSDEN